MKNNKHKETIFVWWMIVVICWVFLKIGTDIHKWQKIDEANERASERASEQEKLEKENERNLEKLRQEFRDEFGKEPSF